MRVLFLLFFCSGAAGLIYQIVWVREFGNAFGNTIHSASLVIAVFMCGLGAGGYLAGRWADRRYRDAPEMLLRAYAYVEAAIAALGLVIALVLPRLGAVSATMSAYTIDAAGWSVPTPASLVARYATAVVLLGPSTLLMGATLTLLIRHLVRHDLGAAGWKIGLLYGVNTAGAAVGCLLTDFALIPAGGLWMTQLTAVGLNLIAAAGALHLATRASAEAASTGDAAPARVPDADAAGVDGARGSAVVPAVIAIFVAGFAAMGMEIVWFRHLTALLGSYRWVFSLILTVILVGIWLGATAGGALHRRIGRPALLYVIAQATFVVVALWGLATAETRAVSATRAGFVALAPVLRELAVPALMMGVTFPLANAIVQDAARAVGRRAGLLYLANTVGAVTGSLIVGFALLGALGMQRTVTILALAVALGVLPLCVVASRRARPNAFALGAAVLALGIGVVVWARLPAGDLLERTLWPLGPGERRLVVSEGITEVVSVTEMTGQGRALLTNGHVMSGTTIASKRYMRAFAHVPLLSHPAPETVLVICFGVGNTAHAATLHPSVRRVEVVDTSRNVLAHAGYFDATNGAVLSDPKLAVFVNDGRQHLRMRPPASYDLITLEPPPIAFAGVASLYSREFYALARSRLRPGGYVTQWLPIYQVSPDIALSMVRAFVDVFPQAVLLSGWMDELILMGINDARLTLDPSRVEERLAAAPAVRADLDRVRLGTLTELVGTFAAPRETLAGVTELFPPVTDDAPIQEYSLDPGPGDTRMLAALFAPERAGAWCPACIVDGRPRPGLEGLPRHLAFLGAVYRAPSFFRYGVPPGAQRLTVSVDPALARAAIAGSRYLQLAFPGVSGNR